MGQQCCSCRATNYDVMVDIELDVVQTLGHPSLARQRSIMKPLVCDLEKVFNEFCDESGKLDVGRLMEVWKTCAEQKHGSLSDSDIRVIEKSAKLYMSTLDMTHDGFISYEEFALFMLGACEKRGQLKDMRTKLHEAMSECPEKLSRVIKAFRALDVDGSGYVRKNVLFDHMGELAELLGGDASAGAAAATELFEEADVSEDGQLALWEVIAHSLGRRKAPVELLLYDLSDGVVQRFSGVLLGQQFEAIYHSSILVFGKEYWYGGKVFTNNPPCRKTFGEPLSSSKQFDLRPSANCKGLRTVHLGYTLATKDEWEKYVKQTLCRSYYPGSYDVITRNCNMFSNECVMFLTGGHIPNQILEQPELMMQTATARLLRPWLNKWLGGWGEGSTKDDCHIDGKQVDCDSIRDDLNLDKGRLVIVPGAGKGDDDVVASIANVLDNEMCDVRFFEPELCDFVTQRVRRGSLKRIISAHSPILIAELSVELQGGESFSL
eukprot:TRINITY_DN14102_c0_g2_i1.p1 TRINITY_DN14102_c0_g2~~TRINITY_DN14102_c0_g2_i1.p1  ORF type:complete len:492 (+),score=81.10 TRINITY_DN14102_c0_g2_i1:108-1583(+)